MFLQVNTKLANTGCMFPVCASKYMFLHSHARLPNTSLKLVFASFIAESKTPLEQSSKCFCMQVCNLKGLAISNFASILCLQANKRFQCRYQTFRYMAELVFASFQAKSILTCFWHVPTRFFKSKNSCLETQKAFACKHSFAKRGYMQTNVFRCCC